MVEGHLLGTGAAPLLIDTPLSRPSVSPFDSPFEGGGLEPGPVMELFRYNFECKSQLLPVNFEDWLCAVRSR
jgi:hypothetical protein